MGRGNATRGEHARQSRLELTLRLAAPYLSAAVFWLAFENAWLTILSYHAQILWWLRGTRPKPVRLRPTRSWYLAVPSALAGPALLVLLPHMARTAPGLWLERYHLTGWSLVFMVFYFGLIHPALEQMHWRPLRERTALAHPLFAGYHLLVLYSLVYALWLGACFVVLWLASWTWMRMMRESGSLVPGVVSQTAADFGIALVAAIIATR